MLGFVVLLRDVAVHEWTVVLCEARVAGVLIGHALNVASEVSLCKESVVRDSVVEGSGFEVVQVGEVGCLTVTEEERLVRVAIIHTVEVFTLEEADQVVLNNWVLSDGCVVGTGGFEADSVTEREDILELVVLESVLVHVHHAVLVTEAGLSDNGDRLGGGVDATGKEVLLNHLISVNVSENSNLLVR